jgi:TonB-linked SusC/RagA family outer membrane protein
MKNFNNISKILFVLLVLYYCLPAAAQENSAKTDSVHTVRLITVKGHVADAASKMPLLGVKIQSNDQLYSAITDEKGDFSISIPEYLTGLYFSAPDYSLLIMPLQGKTYIEAALYPAAFRANYNSETALNSQITVQPRSMSSLTADAEIQSLLGGDMRVITHSGTPGIGASMFIRGFNSLNAGSQPLIMVDGVIFDNQYDRTSIHEGFILNPLANISVDDIESITVIKDGISEYGLKSGNGILSIETKRGRTQATSITASAMYGYNQRPQTLPLLDAAQFRVYASDMVKSITYASQISSLPFLNDNPSYFDYLRYHNDNNWANDVYRNSATRQCNVNVSGGDDVALYYLSMGYANSQSTIQANDFTRFNARFNADIDLTTAMKILFDISYTQTDRNLRDDGFNENPAALVSSPSALALIKSPLLIPYEYSNLGLITTDLSDADFLSIANPVSIIKNAIGRNSQKYLSLLVRPSYQVNKNLKVGGLFNYSMNNLFESYFRPNAGVASVILPEIGEISNSYVQGQSAKQLSITGNLYLNWAKKHGAHSVSATGGVRFLNDSYKGEYGSGHNTASDLDHNLSGSLAYRRTTGYDDVWRSLSYYAQGEYNLREKYYLQAGISANASSRFGYDAEMLKLAGVPWGVFPQINAAWIISAEEFMKKLPFVNFLKLHAGYGLFGNDNIPATATTSYLSSIRYINEYTGKTLAAIGNTRLKPETVGKASAGIDANLFADRMSVSVSAFHNITSNLLLLKQFDYIAGMENYWTNEGKLQNTGFEIAANVKALNLKNFQWEIGASVSHYKNEILELPNGDYSTTLYNGEIRTAVGRAAGEFFGYKTDGVFTTTAEAEQTDLKIRNATGIGHTAFAAGDVRFVDLNPDGFIDDELDKTVIGNPNPDFTGSFNTRIAYRRLSLNALFTFSYGNDVYNYVRSQLESGKNLYNQSAAMQNRWFNEGQHTDIPRSEFGDPMGNSRFSDRWIEDGSYLRLKTISLSYEVPVNSIFLSGFTLWIAANNLWTATKYLGADPEFSVSNSILYQGIDAGMLAQGRSYFVGLKLNL